MKSDVDIRDRIDSAQPLRPSRAPSDSLEIRRWTPRAPESIPPRPWLCDTMLLRGEVTGLGGAGGRGKTAFAIAVVVSMVTGQPLLGISPRRTAKCLYLHLEESDDEFDRRIVAACLHYGIDQKALSGRLFARNAGDSFIIAGDRNGEVKQTPIRDEIIVFCKENEIDVIVVDPFIVSHDGDENSNQVMDGVVRIWKAIAVGAECAVLLNHHFRKGAAIPGDPDAFRGAGAFIGACRCALTMTPMGEQEAQTLGVSDEERRSLIRLDNAKQNMATAGKERLFKLVPVNLENGTNDYPEGDSVQVVEPWKKPDAFADLTPARAREIVLAIDAGMEKGERYTDRQSRQNTRWAGHPVMSMADKTEADARRILRTWLVNKVLFRKDYHSKGQRRRVSGLYANPDNLPS